MKNLLILLTFVLVLFTSCKKGGVTDCFHTTGNITKEERSIESFNNILLKDNVNLILNKSESNSITVEAGSNLLDGIITQVGDNGVLEIRNDNRCNWIRSFDNPINVYLDYIDIDTFEYRSIGNVSTTDTLTTDTLWLKVLEGAGEINMKLNVNRLYCALNYGTADIILEGNCGLAFVYSASFGLINMFDLESTFVFINNRSSNDVYVRATNQLGVTIENVGNVYYAGNPPIVNLNRTGSGELIKLPD